MAVCLHHILSAGVQNQKSAFPFFERSEIPLVGVKLAGEGDTGYITAKSVDRKLPIGQIEIRQPYISNPEPGE